MLKTFLMWKAGYHKLWYLIIFMAVSVVCLYYKRFSYNTNLFICHHSTFKANTTPLGLITWKQSYNSALLLWVLLFPAPFKKYLVCCVESQEMFLQRTYGLSGGHLSTGIITVNIWAVSCPFCNLRRQGIFFSRTVLLFNRCQTAETCTK